MILSSFVLPSRVNQNWHESGIDSLEHCRDKQHFKSYPHKIEYCYNSRGFRDREWPNTTDELKDAIWCFGDSFTVGLGSPIDHTWAHLLSQRTNKRCINVSMDGASNQWIARKLIEVIEEINPKLIFVQWSYLHRNESSDSSLSDEERRIDFDLNYSDIENNIKFLKLVESFCHNNHNIVHTVIPNSGLLSHKLMEDKWNRIKGTSWPEIVPKSKAQFSKLENYIIAELKSLNLVDDFMIYSEFCENTVFNNVIEVDQIDFARDSHHYDLATSKLLVDKLIQLV